jgi:hypothetical protein
MQFVVAVDQNAVFNDEICRSQKFELLLDGGFDGMLLKIFL